MADWGSDRAIVGCPSSVPAHMWNMQATNESPLQHKNCATLEESAKQ